MPTAVVSAVAVSAVAVDTPGVVEIGAPPPSSVQRPVAEAVQEAAETTTSMETKADTSDESASSSSEDIKAEDEVADVDPPATVEDFHDEVDDFRAELRDDTEPFADADGFVEISEGPAEVEDSAPSDPDAYANEAKLTAMLDGLNTEISSNADSETNDVAESDGFLEEDAADTAEPVAELSQDVEVLEIGDQIVDSSVQNVSLQGFSRWEPSGAWPASTPSVAEAPKFETIAHRPNSRPVFDRYTWCELGRSVTPSPRTQREAIPTMLAPAAWPPSTAGVAPEDTIPSSRFDGDYADLLMDLDTLVDVTQQEASYDVHAMIRELTGQDFMPPTGDEDATDQLQDDRKGLEESIERIQSLIDVEQSDIVPPDPRLATPPEPEPQEFDERPEESGDENGWDSGPMQTDTSVPPADEAAIEELGRNFNEPWLTVPFDANASNNSHDADELLADEDPEHTDSLPYGVDGGGRERNPLESFDDDGTLDDEDVSLDEDELLVSDRRVGDFVGESEEELEKVYTPRLLKQARQRIVTRSSGAGKLKRAAGGESISIANTESSEESQTPRLAITPQPETDSPDATAAIEGGKSGFSSLFTRLRKLRDR